MEVFGVVAASVTLGAELLRISRSLKEMIKKIRYARREIEDLAKEMVMFSKLYEQFLDAYRTASKSETSFSSAAECLISWTMDAIHDFKILRNKVRALAGDPKYSVLDTIAAHVRWYFSETAVKYLRASLIVARESMIGITNIRAIQKLDEQLKELRTALTQEHRQAVELKFGMTVEQYIQDLETRKRNRRKQRHEIAKSIEEAKKVVKALSNNKRDPKDFVPRTQQLFSLSKSVDKYVEQVLPMRESGKRPRTASWQVRPPSLAPLTASSGQTFQSRVFSSSTESGRSMNESATTTTTTSLEPPPSASTKPASEYLNYCEDCSGTCIRTEAHGTAVSHSLPAQAPTCEVPLTTDTIEISETPFRGMDFVDDASQGLGADASVVHGSDTGPVGVNGGDDGEDNGGAFDQSDEAATSESDEETNDKRDSVFQPVAGVKGRHPRGWHQRHERSNSPQDFWHRKI
ncbi:Nn.00g045670.m01.CDS01 [Neocucurbitaria sp. VM-36]